jgi:hypothetical protein
MTDLIFVASPWFIVTLMLVVLILAIEVPYRFAGFFSRYKANIDTFNAVQAALLTLSAFVLGLSFSQASGRFDARRALSVNEANAIGTAWLRANQLDPPDAREFRQILTADTAARLKAYAAPQDARLNQVTTEQADHDQQQLWTIASTAMREHESSLGVSLLMQSVNTLIDTISQQRQSLASHVPTAIIVLTLCLVTLATLSLGIRFALPAHARSW